MINARLQHAREPSGSAPTNEMNSVVEQHDTSHEIADDVLDQRSICSKQALGGNANTHPGGAGATIGNTISTVVHSSPYYDD